MADDRKKGSRVLRFAVTGALLVSPLAAGCDEERIYVNEPPQEPVPNPGIEDGPQLPAPTPNTPAHPPGTEAPEPTAPEATAPEPTEPANEPSAPSE